MSLSQGNLVIVEHTPQNDPMMRKARPALIISSARFNNDNLDIIILLISSVVRHNSITDLIITDRDECFAQTGLRRTSAIRCGSICSFPKSRVRRRLGFVPTDILKEAVSRVHDFIAVS